jgi:hypothetical protein
MKKHEKVNWQWSMAVGALVLSLVWVSCSLDADEEKPPIEGSAIVFNDSVQANKRYTEELIRIPGGIENFGDAPYENERPVLHAPPATDSTLRADFQTKLNSLKGTPPQGDPSGPSVLQEVAAAQLVSFVDTINTEKWSLRDGTTQKNTTRIQTNYYVWSVYSYDNNKDYYFIEQEIIIPNGNLWHGKRKKLNGWYYRSKDFWMDKLYTNNIITDSNKKVLDGNLIISKYSPETVNDSTSYTSGVAWNIGAKVGVASDGKAGFELSGGVTFSNSHTWTVQDIGVTAKVMSDITTKNASWQWDTQKRAKYLASVDISDPANLAISTARFGATWIWVVNNPGKKDSYTLKSTIGGAHVSTSFYATGADMSNRIYGWSFDHSLVLNPPPRTSS